MKKSTLINTLIALMVALTAVTAVGLYLFIKDGDYIIAAIMAAIYPVGIIAGIATIKYELEN